MYRVDYSDERAALKIIYRFLSIPFLTKPECSVWRDNGFANTVTDIKKEWPTEADFLREINNTPFKAISCTAATDRADKRRVALAYTPEIDMMVLSFPQANGKLNDREKQVFDYLYETQ